MWDISQDDIPEYRTLGKRKYVKARKDHPCSSCNQPIKAGETYIKEAALVEGDFHAIKCHTYCPSYNGDV